MFITRLRLSIVPGSCISSCLVNTSYPIQRHWKYKVLRSYASTTIFHGRFSRFASANTRSVLLYLGQYRYNVNEIGVFKLQGIRLYSALPNEKDRQSTSVRDTEPGIENASSPTSSDKTTTHMSEGSEENPPARRTMFQRAKLSMKSFTHGCKLLFYDVKHALKIRSKLKHLGNDVSGLTRTELRHMRQTSKDVVKTLPVTIVAFLPIIGYAAPVLAFLFPRQLLSSHFWRPEQKEKFTKEDHEKRSQYYIPLLKEAGWSGLELSNNELTTFCVMLIDGGHARNPHVKKFKTLFREDDLSLKGMPRFHLVKLCKTWLAPAKWYMPRGLLQELLAYRIKRIMEDDDAIRREGVSSLDDEEVAQACHNRGLEEAPHSAECLRLWLMDWVELSSRTSQMRDISYVAHCAIFKSVNFDCEGKTTQSSSDKDLLDSATDKTACSATSQ